MSLLEDVFLEDEAGEAQELERVIEGDEFDERPAPHSGEDSNDNSEKEDEAEEDKRRVDPTSAKTKRISKNPRVLLNPARLTGPRGIQVIPDHFKDFKFKGKGHEKEDLDLVLKKLEHWAYRLYPKFQFEDCLKKIETLGKKRPVMVHLHKIRSDQYISDDVVVQKDSSDDETPQPLPEEDEFDKLLQQQIELARATPAPNSAKKGFGTPRLDTPSFSMPKATSSPSISDEQKERMLRNRRLAEERRLARQKIAEQNITVINEEPIEVEDHQNSLNIDRKNVTVVNEVPFDVENHQNEFDEPRKKQNRSRHVIDSSDEDCEELVVNESITVDVHDTRPNIDENTMDHSNRSVEAKKNNRSNIIDSSDEIVDKSNDDGYHETEFNEPIKHKSNIIEDGSDDDTVSSADIQDTGPSNSNLNDSNKSKIDEVLAIDEEINAEIIKPNATDIVEVLQNETGDNITNTIMQTEFEVSNEKDVPDKQTNHENVLDIADHSDINNIDDIISDDSNTNSKNIEKNNIMTEELKNSNSFENSPLNNKENVDNNMDLELMDVDFNEDF